MPTANFAACLPTEPKLQMWAHQSKPRPPRALPTRSIDRKAAGGLMLAADTNSASRSHPLIMRTDGPKSNRLGEATAGCPTLRQPAPDLAPEAVRVPVGQDR